MNDPIVDEIRRIRDDYAARFNYDLDAMFRDIKEQEAKSGRTLHSYGPRMIDSTQSTSNDAATKSPRADNAS